MGSLGLHADPDGWLNAGYSIRTLMDSLDSELYDADRTGGAGLSAHWAGPVAEAFNGNWSGLRSRAEDLIAQGRRAAAAITDFGGRLEDFVKRAADLESYWLSFGLQLGLDGMHFALPWGFEQLSPVHQVSFHQWLTESERDVTAMWSDIEGRGRRRGDRPGVADRRVRGLRSARARCPLLGGARHRGRLSSATRNAIPSSWCTTPCSTPSSRSRRTADAAERFAGWRGRDVRRSRMPLTSPRRRSWRPDAEQVAATTGVLSNVAKVGTPVALIAANVTTAAVVGYDINRDGWRVGLEKNAGLYRHDRDCGWY